MERVEIVVRGRVQGVAFRWHARGKARQLGLVGWVRNLADGRVRLVAEGPRAALEALCDWAAAGPDHARVDGREIHWSDAAGDRDDFTIR